MVDDATASTIDGRLPPELGLAEMRDGAWPTSTLAWALVAPGLRIPPRAAACPYRGLLAFGSEDGDLFFGREEVVASLVDRVLDGGFMAVVGASGSGKSSLLRAGLVPAYGRTQEGPVVVMTPGSEPGSALSRSLSPGQPSLLVVDQLEEVFTLCPDEATRAEFIDALFDLRETASTSIVVALRADLYGHCANHPRLADAVAEHQLLLGAMQTDDLRRAIESPARAGGLRLEAGLVDAMLADVEGEPGALPLLSHALYESWARRDGRVLTFEGYRAAGGVRGAIAHTAEDVFAGCTQGEQELVRRMFVRLTELGEGTEDTRRRVSLSELIPEAEGGAEATAVLEKLASSRLLVVGDGSAEIAHEALIREWPRLRGWLTEDRDELRVLRQLTTAARSWEENGRDDADLYRGARLEGTIERIDDHVQLAPIEREFLEASRDAQERELRDAQRRARRLRVLLAVVAAALVVAVIAGAFALVQRGSARHTATVAQAGRLAAQSREVAGRQPDLGLLLALEAGQPRRLGRLARRAPRRARARLADPRLAPGVRLARGRNRIQSRSKAPGDDDVTRRDHALGHGDVEARRTAAALGAGRVVRVSTSAPTDGRSRSPARRVASSCGTSRRGRSSGSWRTRPPRHDVPMLSAVRFSPDGSTSSPPALRRRTTSRSGTPRAVG